MTSPANGARTTDVMLADGDHEMRQRVRAMDWGATALGDASEWSPELRTSVDIMLASSFPMIILWGPQLIQIYNDGYRVIMGAKHPAGLGMPTEECWPEVWHINGPIYDRVRAGETVSAMDACYPLMRGGHVEDVYLTISYAPVREDGEVAGVFITMLETTARVKARAAEDERERLMRELDVERRRLEIVFKQAPAFLAVLRGPTHVFQLANDAYNRLVGHRELIGLTAAEVFPELKHQGFFQLIDDVYTTGKPFVGREIPISLQLTAGAALEERFLDFVYQPLTDGENSIVGIVAHGTDVTEQVLARREVERVNEELERSSAELKASEQRLRDIFEQAPVAVAVLSGPDHVYTIASPRYRESPGSGRRLIGLPMREAFPEVGEQGILEILQRVYTTGVPFFANERLVKLDRDRDGATEDYYYNVGYQPLRNVDGEVYAIASVAYDVTEHVRARHELEKAREAAEAARQEAETANQAKSDFLTTMSHELRTPLNAVAGYSDLMLMGVRGALTDGQREDLERIKRSGQYLLGLINDVLNFAKLDAGQVEFRLADVPVAPLLDGLDDLIRPQVSAKGLEYSNAMCDGSVRVHADPEKVRQILLNLLTNSVKFTESGGSVELKCESSDHDVRLSVRDTGRGIPSDELSRVFDPFVQVDRHLTPQSQQGVGLGLAISRDLATGMHGSLTAESEPGRGSCFMLTLPRA